MGYTMAIYRVQIGKIPSGKYTTIYQTENEIMAARLAFLYYRKTNAGCGYKKRLIKITDAGQKILFKEAS